MKLKLKKYIIALLTAVALIFPSSCSDDFLDVKNPSKLDPSEFPVDLHSFELMMNSLYGQLRDGFYGEYFRSMPLIDHGNDNGYDGAEFNEFALINLNPNLVALRESWSDLYSHIAKCNDFIIKLREYEELDSEKTSVAQMEAEAKFLRALNYFQLVNMFGESPILTEADKGKMGIPLWVDELPQDIVSSSRGRATQGEIYNQIIADLEAAAPVLKGVGKINKENPRIDEWAVKSLLAKSYMYTLQWGKAVPVLKDIIDNSGKELVSYDIFRNMFSGRNEYSKESIWEVDFVYDPQTNDRREGTGAIYQRFVSLTVLDGTGKEVVNGYSNYYVHDQNIPRYGFDDGVDGKYTAAKPKTAHADSTARYEAFLKYKEYSLKVRGDKSVDPRLYVTAYQPYVDSVNFLDQSWGWCPIVKGRMEGYPNRDMRAWNNRKYAADDDWYVGNCG
ncbi:MAG: RagB/SusD family nutrient uptake outer membrane protein, partial [Bacteroidales bacterium]|nr:RagB/SusD family nutrient uptake outer membrane protein [Bacteroidales bacterium]